jgi:hypothetical protein
MHGKLCHHASMLAGDTLIALRLYRTPHDESIANIFAEAAIALLIPGSGPQYIDRCWNHQNRNNYSYDNVLDETSPQKSQASFAKSVTSGRIFLREV